MLAAQGGAGSRMYNPYAGLPGAFDPAMSRQLLQLPEAPEFVFSEEAAVKHRGVSENLTFITGSAYLCGALAGGAYGSYQALNHGVPGASDSTKCAFSLCPSLLPNPSSLTESSINFHNHSRLCFFRACAAIYALPRRVPRALSLPPPRTQAAAQSRA